MRWWRRWAGGIRLGEGRRAETVADTGGATVRGRASLVARRRLHDRRSALRAGRRAVHRLRAPLERRRFEPRARRLRVGPQVRGGRWRTRPEGPDVRDPRGRRLVSGPAPARRLPDRRPGVLIIVILRGQKVILDRDLASLYRVTTSNLNKAVSRNLQRFPADFMFQLSPSERSNLIFQSGTSSWGGTRKPPRAFTEQGVAMTPGPSH